MKFFLITLLLASNFSYSSPLRHKVKQGFVRISKSPIVSKIQQKVASGLVAITISCTALSCGNGIFGEGYSRGDNIYFVRNGLAYSGVVERDLGDDLYLIENINGTNMQTTATIDEIEAQTVYQPELVGRTVVLEGIADGVKYRRGTIREVYENDYVEIRITHEIMYNNDLIRLSEPYRIFIDRERSLNEGGFVIGNFF